MNFGDALKKLYKFTDIFGKLNSDELEQITEAIKRILIFKFNRYMGDNLIEKRIQYEEFKDSFEVFKYFAERIKIKEQTEVEMNG